MEFEQKNKGGPKTILIFGISSFIGSNLAEIFKRYYKVVGTYHKTTVKIPGILTLPCDVLKKEEVQLAIYAVKPDIIVYAVGKRSVSDCADSPEVAEALNSSGLFNVAEYGQRYRAQICSITSQYVFSGTDRQYVEMDIPDPETTLGKSQSSAEFYIQKTALNYLIFRCCNLYGRGIKESKENFFETLQRKLFIGDPVGADDSVRSGFLDVVFLATLMRVCFEKKVNNRLFQVCSSDTVNHYEFAKLYTEVFKESEQGIYKKRWNFNLMGGLKPADRELNYYLDSINLESFLNVKMPTVKESLEFTFKRLNGIPKASKKRSKGDGINYI